MGYLFTSESVSEGHPDKVADQISDAVLDNLLAYDPTSKVACETLVTTGQVVVAGEVKSNAYVDLQEVARETINRIGYTKSSYKFDGESCGVLNAIHEQSGDINRGVERESPEEQGAGDQGMMFGYATNETENCMPLSLDLSHRILRVLADIRREGKVMTYVRPNGKVATYLRPDAKSQVTIEYGDDGKPLRVHTVVVSTQHDEFVPVDGVHASTQDEADEQMLSRIKEDVVNILIPRVIEEIDNEKIASLFKSDITYHVNPTGKFVIGGPHGDTGLTGRKIIVDTYGGRGAHGGGAFSGKDPSKVDRSAAYAARHIAKNMVVAGVADEMLVQLSYAIGVAKPVSIYVNTYGTSKVAMSDGEIAEKIDEIFDLRPHAIEKRFDLRKPIYQETASYGHFGRKTEKVLKKFTNRYQGDVEMMVTLFPWEETDAYQSAIKEMFGIKD
jgi:S-adenosylmethionine synthetase